jgi:MATE family multidrug resistance protein
MSRPARERGEDDAPSAAELRGEARRVARVAAPTVLVNGLALLQWAYTSHVVGQRFGAVGLTAQSLSMLSGNLLVASVVTGFLSACDSLLPQAFAAGRRSEVGLIAVRGFVVTLVLVCALLVPLLGHAEALLLALGQPAEPVRLTGRFLRIYQWAFPGVCVFESIVRFLRAQEVVVPLVLVNVVVCGLHPLCLHWLVERFGFDGVPLAHVLSTYLGCFVIVLTLRHGSWHAPDTLQRLPSGWGWASARELLRPRDLWALARLGLPGIVANGEWWFWEAVLILAGLFGTSSAAAYTLAYTISPLAYVAPSALSVAVSVRVGQLMSTGRILLAQALVRWALAASLAMTSLAGLAVYFSHEPLVRAFIRDTDVEVTRLAAMEWPFLSSMIVLDGVFAVLGGVVRALSLQAKMSVAVLCVMWGLGLPAMWFLAVRLDLELLGIWLALPATYVLLDAILLRLFYTADWHDLAKSIQEQFRDPNPRALELGASSTQAKGAKAELEAAPGSPRKRHVSTGSAAAVPRSPPRSAPRSPPRFKAKRSDRSLLGGDEDEDEGVCEHPR